MFQSLNHTQSCAPASSNQITRRSPWQWCRCRRPGSDWCSGPSIAMVLVQMAVPRPGSACPTAWGSSTHTPTAAGQQHEAKSKPPVAVYCRLLSSKLIINISYLYNDTIRWCLFFSFLSFILAAGKWHTFNHFPAVLLWETRATYLHKTLFVWK